MRNLHTLLLLLRVDDNRAIVRNWGRYAVLNGRHCVEGRERSRVDGLPNEISY